EGEEALPAFAADFLLALGHRLLVVDQPRLALADELADDVVLNVIGTEAMAGGVLAPAAHGEAAQPGQPDGGAGQPGEDEAIADQGSEAGPHRQGLHEPGAQKSYCARRNTPCHQKSPRDG